MLATCLPVNRLYTAVLWQFRIVVSFELVTQLMCAYYVCILYGIVRIHYSICWEAWSAAHK